MVSILDSIKKLLGIDPTDTSFDDEIVMDVNSVFSILSQLGLGPPDGFFIQDNTQEWSSFLGERKDLEFVKTYIYQKVRLMFDPPQNSFLVDSIKKQCEEFEWRLNVQISSFPLEVSNDD